MNKYFNIKDNVYDITEKFPETIDLFFEYGFEQFKNETMRKLMGKTISMEIACKSKKINTDLFEEKLVEVIEQARTNADGNIKGEINVTNVDIKIDGILPCPVRLPMLEGFEQWLEDNPLDFTIEYDLKVASGGVDWIKEKIQNIEDENKLSDIFMSAGFDLFFDKELMGKFKSKGVFEDITGFAKFNSDFDNEYIDLKDPDRQYSIIGVVPAVFLVNTEELDGRKMPSSWEDILSPEFENAVSLPIGDFDLFNSILLNIYKKFGEDGLRRLGKSLLRSMHPSEMVKSHIKKDNKPVVTIMPYFFTKMIKRGGPMVSVWPRDGAIISPIFLLTKNSKKEQIKPFVDYFASKEVGEILSHNGKFPSINPEVDNRLGEDQKFMWLGWDYINNHDIGELINKCEKIFNESI